MNLTPQEQQSIQAIIGSAYQVRQENGHEVRDLDADVVTHGIWQLTLNKVKQLAQQGIWFSDEQTEDFFEHALAYAGSHYDESFSPVNGAFFIKKHYSDLYGARVNHFTSQQANVVLSKEDFASSDDYFEKEMKKTTGETEEIKTRIREREQAAQAEQQQENKQICQASSQGETLLIPGIVTSTQQQIEDIVVDSSQWVDIKGALHNLSIDLAEEHGLVESQRLELLGHLEESAQEIAKEFDVPYEPGEFQADIDEIDETDLVDLPQQQDSQLAADLHSSFSISVAINSFLGALCLVAAECTEALHVELAGTAGLLREGMGNDSMLAAASEKASNTFGKFSGTFFSLADDFNNKAGKLDQTNEPEKSFSEMEQDAIDMQGPEYNTIASL